MEISYLLQWKTSLTNKILHRQSKKTMCKKKLTLDRAARKERRQSLVMYIYSGPSTASLRILNEICEGEGKISIYQYLCRRNSICCDLQREANKELYPISNTADY